MSFARSVVLATVVAALVSAPAAASVRFGSALTANPGGSSTVPCPGSQPTCTFALVTKADAGSAAAPSAGVIVQWWIRSGSAAALAPQVIRPGSGATAAVVAAGEPVSVPGSGQATVWDTRLPVRVGDLFGVRGSGTPAAFGSHSAALTQQWAPALDTTARNPDSVNNAEMLIAAAIEPDADLDGYGDETQDLCPADPARHSACSADLALTVDGPQSAVIDTDAVHTYTARNLGTSPAVNVVVTMPAPAGATLKSVTATGGTCTTGATLRCVLGTIASGAARSMAITFSVSEPKSVGTAAHAAQDTADPASANNDASLSTVFTPPSVAPEPVALPTPACANTLLGTRDDDALTGTSFGDWIRGLEGRDLIRGGAGDDCLEGGRGNDVLDGDGGNDRLNGGFGADRLTGGFGADTLTGGTGDDYLSGSFGADVLRPGPGRDRVLGGPGNDSVDARDGRGDRIDCGAGFDTVSADRVDRVRNCEKRVKAASKPR